VNENEARTRRARGAILPEVHPKIVTHHPRARSVILFERKLCDIAKRPEAKIHGERLWARATLEGFKRTGLGPEQDAYVDRCIALTKKRRFGKEEALAIVSGSCILKFNLKD
jgi:hypothetical protein